LCLQEEGKLGLGAQKSFKQGESSDIVMVIDSKNVFKKLKV